MRDAERDELIQKIESEIKKLTLKIEELKDFTQPIAPDDAIGRISRMDAINNKSIYDASMRNSQERLHQLNNVLKTVYDDDFGICIKCRQSIPIERLKIRPEIRFCAGCFKR